jgi:hypothetical protein
MAAVAALRRGASALCVAASLSAMPMTAAWADDAPVGSARSADGHVRIDVLSLKRTEGDTATLRFTVVNDGNADFSIVLLNMHLIDLVARRSYDVGLSSSSCNTPPGKQLTCWAMFAAPPPNTRTITVRFYEPIDLITGVPITG